VASTVGPGALSRRESCFAAWGHAAYRMELNPGRTLEGVGFTGARLICGMGIAKGSGWEQSQSPGRRVPSCQSPDSRCLRTRTRTQPGGRYSYSIPIPTRRTSPCVHRPEYEYPPRSSRAKDHVDPQSRISAESLRAFSPSYSYSARRAVLVLDPCISSIGSWGHSPHHSPPMAPQGKSLPRFLRRGLGRYAKPTA